MHTIVHGLSGFSTTMVYNYERCVMKIVVIGGGGLTGKKLVPYSFLPRLGYVSAHMRRWQRPVLQVSTPLLGRDLLMCWWMLRLLSR